MLLFILGSIIILAVSFFFALRSMRDFAESPKSLSKNGLFLIRKLQNLPQALDIIYPQLKKSNLIISLERLFKGEKSAVVIFGPIDILRLQTTNLDLLEIEDFLNISAEEVNNGQVLAWEMGLKGPFKSANFFQGLSKLIENEQFFWQCILRPLESELFQANIRELVLADNPVRTKELQDECLKLGNRNNLFSLPVPFTKLQLINFFKERTFIPVKLNPKSIALNLSKEDLLYSLLFP